MALTPAVIEDRTENVLANKIGLVSYDENALGHDVYRRTNASMEGDPEANGQRVGVQIDPTEDFVDANIETGDTYHYAVISRTQLDAEAQFIKVLKDASLDHILDDAYYMIHPEAKDNELTGNTFTKIVSFDAEKREREQVTQVRLHNGFFRIDPEAYGDSGSLYLPMTQIDRAGQFYLRFWAYLDYSTSTGNSNTDFVQHIGNDFTWRLDSDRPRSDIDFLDSSNWDSRRSSVLVGGRWDLHEIIWDYDTSFIGWRKQRNGVFTDTSVVSSTRPAGTELLTNGLQELRLGSTSANLPRMFGSIYYSRTLPTVQERETWYNAEKGQYGYV